MMTNDTGQRHFPFRIIHVNWIELHQSTIPLNNYSNPFDLFYSMNL